MLKATMTKLKSKPQARPVKSPEIQALPLVPWVGGKRRLAQHILPLFPEHSCYVEPFCGAAALFFLKEPAKVEVLNDVHGELVRLYRVVQNHLDEFVRQFRWALASREMYGWLQAVPPDTLTDIQRAARFFYLQKLGFGGKVDLSSRLDRVSGWDGAVIDFKTKDTLLDKVDVYFEHILQLAAYRQGLEIPHARCAIVFVNGTTNEVKLIEIEEEELQRGWECYWHLLKVYQLKNGLK